MKSLSTGEIAKYCDVNLRTVIRWIDKGELKGYKLPGRGNNRVQQEDFVAFLQAHQMPVPPEFQNLQPKILIVDDEVQVAKAIQRVVKRLGFDNQIATDGFKAGTLLGAYQPSLMTLDLSMPGLDGFEVLKFTRSQAAFTHLKILVISALDDAHLTRALDSGADATLSKPFNNDELKTNIHALLGQA